MALLQSWHPLGVPEHDPPKAWEKQDPDPDDEKTWQPPLLLHWYLQLASLLLPKNCFVISKYKRTLALPITSRATASTTGKVFLWDAYAFFSP